MVKQYFTLDGEIQAETDGTSVREYHSDALGSVTSTIVDGAIENTYAYKPYGELLQKTGSGEDPKFAWAGAKGYRSALRVSGYGYVRARSLSSHLGRWITRDELWPEEHPFAYLLGSPITHTDPSGLRRDNQGYEATAWKLDATNNESWTQWQDMANLTCEGRGTEDIVACTNWLVGAPEYGAVVIMVRKFYRPGGGCSGLSDYLFEFEYAHVKAFKSCFKQAVSGFRRAAKGKTDKQRQELLAQYQTAFDDWRELNLPIQECNGRVEVKPLLEASLRSHHCNQSVIPLEERDNCDCLTVFNQTEYGTRGRIYRKPCKGLHLQPLPFPSCPHKLSAGTLGGPRT